MSSNSALSEAYIEALKKFDVKAMKNFFKHWDNITYKGYSNAPYVAQKKIICKEIIRLEKFFDDELLKRARDYLKGHEL